MPAALKGKYGTKEYNNLGQTVRIRSLQVILTMVFFFLPCSFFISWKMSCLSVHMKGGKDEISHLLGLLSNAANNAVQPSLMALPSQMATPSVEKKTWEL